MGRLDFDTPRAVPPFPDVNARSLAYRERHAAQRHAEVRERLAVSPPRTAATPTPLDAEYVPRGVRTVGKLLDAHGWRWRLTRAVGPRIGAGGKVAEPDCASLDIAGVSPDGQRRILWAWRYEPAKGTWKFEDALTDGEGRVTSTRASQIVKGGAS